MYENVKKCLELLPVSYDLYRMARRALNDEEKAQLLWFLKSGRAIKSNIRKLWQEGWGKRESAFLHSLTYIYLFSKKKHNGYLELDLGGGLNIKPGKETFDRLFVSFCKTFEELISKYYDPT